MLLAHHHDDQRERCAVVAGRDVCRRCLALYPVLLATMIAVALGVGDAVPAAWRDPLVWLLPLPAAADYVADAFGRARYAPTRQVSVTVPLAVAGGAGFAWEQQAPGTVTFWVAVVVYGLAALAVTVAGWLFEARQRAEQRHRDAIADAEARLETPACTTGRFVEALER